MRFDSGRRQSSWGLRDARPVCWVRELRFWLLVGQSSWVDDCRRWRNSQHSKDCVSLSSCRKTKTQEVNKRFVPELPRVVSVSGFLCIWIFYIFIFWLCYMTTIPSCIGTKCGLFFNIVFFCGWHMSSIGVTMLESSWSKYSSTADTMSSYEIITLFTFQLPL